MVEREMQKSRCDCLRKLFAASSSMNTVREILVSSSCLREFYIAGSCSRFNVQLYDVYELCKSISFILY